MNTAINVAIVEDVKDIRESLSTLISGMQDYNCVGAYATAEAAIADMHSIKPDVVLMDINLPGMNGVEAVKIIKQQHPDINVIMCTVFEDEETIFKALSAGAGGYILKSMRPHKLLEAIREVNEGGAPMSASIAKHVISSFSKSASITKHESLTAREMEVLQLLSKGLLYKEAADKLGLSVETIRSHCRNIYEKLHVNTKLEAINIVFGKK